MRDDDHLRHYMPLLRRIVILLAVLTAVPVVLWTITAFVHSYVAPPRAPNYRPLALTPPAQNVASTAPTQDATQPAAPSDPLPTITEARAATIDARGAAPGAASGPLVSDARAPAAPDAKAPAAPVSAPMVTAAIPATMSNGPAQPAAADAAAASVPPTAAPPPSADELAPAQPLTGPIPLPRHRPRYFAMAKEGPPQADAAPASGPKPRMPMPRPRPNAAGAAAPPTETASGPLDWIQGIFRQ